VLVGAGDIALCDAAIPNSIDGAKATANQLDNIPGTVIALGDLAYYNGSRDEFRNCYDPTWGRHKARTCPLPGNHEYQTPGAAGYYEYFPDAAGPGGQGYYRRTIGTWTVIWLNSEIDVSANSAQTLWLKAELTASPTACTAVMWHRPLFSSGPNGNYTPMRDVWQVLYQNNVDVVLNGHDHMYERFAPQDADGRADPKGPQEFIVGTGGGSPSPFNAPRKPNHQEERVGWGVLKLELNPGSYTWTFLPVDPTTPPDSGSASCR